MERSRFHAAVALLLTFPLLAAGSCRGRSPGPEPQARTTPPPAEGLSEESGDDMEAGAAEAKEDKKAEVTMTDKYEITPEEKKWLMKLAKDAVKAAVEGKKFDPPEPATQLLKDKGAAFVTLRKKEQLRGCIGHIIAHMPLYKCVASVARSAALEDPRFSPVSPAEYDSLHFEISVLTPPEDVKDPEEIVVGQDGVIINYGGMYQGVFLPQVPTEQGWDRIEYLDNLCYKAGVMKKGCWKEPQAALRKFQAVVWEEEDVK
jgi:AmmeMemoRadiSam system protein A